MRTWQLTLGVIVFFILAAVAGIAHAYKNFLRTPLIPLHKSAVTYVLLPGTSIHTLAVDLTRQGLIRNPIFLMALAYSKNMQNHLKAGEYLFAPGLTPEQVLAQIIAGKVVQHRFTIVEGWTFSQLMTVLNKESLITHTLNNLSAETIASKLKLPAHHPEGWFLPATYNFIRGASDISILEKAYRLMDTKLNHAWQLKSAEVPYRTPYEVLIAASLVEKETAQPQERPLIAGVILKRLQINMPLQIDSTVIYGLGTAYVGKLHGTDLRQDTPYNTYTRRGLPPTPIALPSEQALKAVVAPAITDALYFVARNDGTHQFSSNLKAHNQAVTTYQIGIVLPNVGRKAEKMKCPQLWYLPSELYFLFSIHCQI